MRVVVLLMCLLVAACQAAPDGGSTERPRSRETFGGRCSPYASNCW